VRPCRGAPDVYTDTTPRRAAGPTPSPPLSPRTSSLISRTQRRRLEMASSSDDSWCMHGLGRQARGQDVPDQLDTAFVTEASMNLSGRLAVWLAPDVHLGALALRGAVGAVCGWG